MENLVGSPWFALVGLMVGLSGLGLAWVLHRVDSAVSNARYAELLSGLDLLHELHEALAPNDGGGMIDSGNERNASVGDVALAVSELVGSSGANGITVGAVLDEPGKLPPSSIITRMSAITSLVDEGLLSLSGPLRRNGLLIDPTLK